MPFFFLRTVFFDGRKLTSVKILDPLPDTENITLFACLLNTCLYVHKKLQVFLHLRRSEILGEDPNYGVYPHSFAPGLICPYHPCMVYLATF